GGPREPSRAGRAGVRCGIRLRRVSPRDAAPGTRRDRPDAARGVQDRRVRAASRSPGRAGAGMTRHVIAVLPGDGIGPEVTTEALRALHAAAELHGFDLA